jgi:hypothetical protein
MSNRERRFRSRALAWWTLTTIAAATFVVLLAFALPGPCIAAAVAATWCAFVASTATADFFKAIN